MLMARILIVLMLLFSPACSDAAPITFDQPTTQPSSELIISLAELLQNVEVPPEVPEDQFPHLSCYVFRTRIVVETATVSLPDDVSETTITVTAVSRTQLDESLNAARKLWEGINLDFDVRSITHSQWQERSISTLWFDAERYPDYLTIVYLLPRRELDITGLSPFPWMTMPHGILIMNEYDKYTLSHELGHYLGLYHTFQEGEHGDHVDDTPPHERGDCGINNNLMSYCETDSPTLTPGQLERAYRFLRYYRQDEVLNPAPDQSKIPMNIGDLLFGHPLQLKFRYVVPDDVFEDESPMPVPVDDVIKEAVLPLENDTSLKLYPNDADN